MQTADFHQFLIAMHNAPSVRALLQEWQVPRTWQHVLRTTQGIFINGQYRSFNQPVVAGELVTLEYSDPEPPVYAVPTRTNASTDNLPLASSSTPVQSQPLVRYDDEQLLIVDKPAGMKAHPNQPGESGTLMNVVASWLNPMPPYITHRLDMATSGLMVIARNPITASIINQQLAAKTLSRTYIAEVPRGIAKSGTITLPIGRDPDDKRKRQVRPDGQAAETAYEVIGETASTARLRITLGTGRTHQIRVHLAALGYPILGDPLYSEPPAHIPERMHLHAAAIHLHLPFGQPALTIESPVPF